MNFLRCSKKKKEGILYKLPPPACTLRTVNYIRQMIFQTPEYAHKTCLQNQEN